MQNLDRYTEDYYTRNVPEFWFEKHGLLRPDELAALCYALNIPFWTHNNLPQREPGLIYSIGCGRGVLESKLESMGYEVIGVDPSEGAKQLYQGSKIIDEYPGGGNTILFVESIEHIPADQREAIWQKIPRGARIIIVNWVDFYPIDIDSTGWDHITRVDDDLFNYLSEGSNVVLRRGSHLVLDKQ